MKSRRKLLSILLTLSLLVTLLVPMVGPAAAAGSYRSLMAPSVTDGAWQTLGTAIIEVDAGALAKDHAVSLRLPTDFKIYDDGKTPTVSVSGSVYEIGDATTGTTVKISTPSSLAGKDNELQFSDLAKPQILSQNEFKISLAHDPSNPSGSKDAAIIKIEFPKVYVKSGFSGDITVIGTASSTSAFPNGSVTIGTVVSGNQKVEISTTNVPSFSSDTTSDPIKIRVTEKKPSALEPGNESLNFKLPSGFKWLSYIDVTKIWGDDVYVTTTSLPTTGVTAPAVGFILTGIGDDELKAQMKLWDPAANSGAGGWVDTKRADGTDGTTAETAFELTLNIDVDDEKDAKVGDVVASTSGSRSDVTPADVTVAKYGDYQTTVEASGDIPTLYAGQLEQRIADIKFTESVKGSLKKDRTVTLTLPANAKWTKIDEDSDSGTGLRLASFPGTDGHEVKFTVTGDSTDAATLTLSKMEVALEPGTTGDLKVEVGGTAGVTGTITVAKVEAPVSMTAASAPEVKIGSVADAGDLIIKEVKAGAIEDSELKIDLPDGVRFATTPKVEVTEGNISIKSGDVRTIADSEQDDNVLSIPIDTSSSVASTIKISGIKIIVDRTVPEGDIVAKVKGSAVSEVNDATEVGKVLTDIRNGINVYINGTYAFDVENSTTKAIFPKTSTAAKAVFAKVVTPASSDVKGKAVFKIGDTKFTLNGVEQTMDVAPYLKNDRTYLPLRFVAQAVGVADNNIIWNADEQSVILIKGDRVVKLVIGSNTMLINGVSFTMDVAPEIVDPGRTMLPVRWVAQALGADIQWDNATQTVTVN